MYDDICTNQPRKEMLTESENNLKLYSDQQVVAGIKELFEDRSFVSGMQAFLPLELSESFLNNYSKIKNSYEFQRDIIRPLLKFLEQISMTSLTGSGLEHLDPQKKYLFISNHRDIGLDSAFINLLLFEKNFTTSQIAIGDNLMKHRIAELIFRINKSFVVKRTGNPRELYQSSVSLSQYIQESITKGKDSVWIAQREGRAKDGNDFTQVSLLKMLALSGRKDALKYFENLNIVPVSISYEYDPCDYLKTKEYIDRLENPKYQKSFNADMASILQGLKGKKGNVHISFGIPLNQNISKISTETKSKEILSELAKLIDTQIQSSYKINPVNYIASDLINNNSNFSKYYTESERKENSLYFENILSRINHSNQKEARKYLLGIYANPLINQHKISKG